MRINIDNHSWRPGDCDVRRRPVWTGRSEHRCFGPRHSLGDRMWPFKKTTRDLYEFIDPPHTTCIACRHVIEKKMPILYASHDADDGGWQFLCGRTDHGEDDAMVVGMGTVTNLHPEVNRIADMPIGVCGERSDIESSWSFYKKSG